jgi:hypothetical protein
MNVPIFQGGRKEQNKLIRNSRLYIASTHLRDRFASIVSIWFTNFIFNNVPLLHVRTWTTYHISTIKMVNF